MAESTPPPPRARAYQSGEMVPDTVYKVIRIIGAGGMGTVYDVEDTSIGKRYVLKTLHPQLGSREDLARRMQQEARTLARLGHPNIVEVITAGVTDDDLKLPYYVMERLEGQSLRIVLEKKGQLELAHAYHIAIDLLDALDHAHDKGVIHRDVKPDNIFLHRTTIGVTVTKLLDFGIVSLLDGTNRETAGRFLGTLRYAAPEQIGGHKPSPKTDIYSAALVLYEMVAGRGPFDEYGDSHQIAAAHLNLGAPALSQFVVIPRELDNLVRAALAKDPDKRPRDAFSFAASLRNLKKALGPRAPQPLGSASTAPVSTTPPGSSPQMMTVKVTDGPVTSLSARIPQEAPTTPDAVDRSAPTNTGVMDTPRMAHHGTEGYAPPPHVPTLPAAESIRWPPDRPAAKSEEPQVRSVLAHPPGERRSVLTAVFTVLVLLAVSATLVGMLLTRRTRRLSARDVPATSAPAPSASDEPPIAPATATPAPPPAPQLPAPAPATAIPPATATATVTATATPTPTPIPTATPAPRPTSKPMPAPKPVATPKSTAAPAAPAAPDRPGPGF